MDNTIISVSDIQNMIFSIRGVKVMIDRDLAQVYGVETKVMNQAVKRNIARFPETFRFNLKSQIMTSSGHGGRRYLPYVFTEQGVSMLSAVLRSDRIKKGDTSSFISFKLAIYDYLGDIISNIRAVPLVLLEDAHNGRVFYCTQLGESEGGV